MDLLQKTYDFKGKIVGSIVENPHKALLNDVEFTQGQYDNIYGSSLKLNLPVSIGISFYFMIDIPKEKIKRVDIIFTAKASDKYVLMRCNEEAKYQSKPEFVQPILNVPIANINTQGQLFFKCYGNKNIDFEIYGVKVNVYYDNDANNRYSGNLTHMDGANTVNVLIDGKTYDELQELLSTMHDKDVQYCTFAKMPVERDVE